MSDVKGDNAIGASQIERTTSHASIALDAGAEAARTTAHQLSPREAIRGYSKAIFWSLMVSMCVIMEGKPQLPDYYLCPFIGMYEANAVRFSTGYDTILIGNFYAYPQFTAKYGQFVDDNGRSQLSAPWQAGLSNGSLVGCFFGGLANGWLVAKFGQKRVILASLVILSAFIFITFFAQNVVMLLLGQFFCGLPWGVFVTSAPAYASEVLPMSLRVYFTSWTNMCFIIGQLIAAGVLAGLVDRPDQWAYRIPFALQWLWPAFLIPILSFAPESPWHLVRVGNLEGAKKSLQRLQSPEVTSKISIETSLAEIVHTNNTEIELSAGTSYMDCFKGTERRRTEIACLAFAGQVLSGSTFAYNSTVSGGPIAPCYVESIADMQTVFVVRSSNKQSS